MRKADKIERIGGARRSLSDPHDPLDHRMSYTLLVAVALSAQTTDKKVNQVTPALFARAATPAAMLHWTPTRSSSSSVRSVWHQSKARNV